MNLRNKLAFWMALNRYVDIIVRGVSPLSLPDAIAGSLRYVKAYGGTYQGVPDGYTMLDSVSNRTQSTCDVNTGVYVDVDDVELEIQVSAKTGSWYIFQSQETQNSTIWGISGANSGAKISFNWGGLVLQSNITRTSGKTYYVKATAKNGNATLYVKDITNNVEDTVTDTYVYGSGPTSWFGIFGTERNPSLAAGNAVYFAKMSVGGKQVLDAIPAQRQSDSVNGFYNKINGQFLIPEELTALNAGTPIVPTPTAPIDITCNNGVLQLRHQSGLPLRYQKVAWLRSTIGLTITGFKTKDTQNIKAKWLKVSNSAQYIYYSDTASTGTTNTTAYIPTTGTGNWRFGGASKGLAFLSGTLYETVQNKNGVWANGAQVTEYENVNSFTSTNDLILLGVSGNSPIRLYSFQIEENGIKTLDIIPVQDVVDNTYGVYDLVNGIFYTNANATFTAGAPVDDPIGVYPVGTQETIAIKANGVTGSTAVAEMLLKVGDYQDEQEIISGAVTRNVGVLILDGTEGWSRGTKGEQQYCYNNLSGINVNTTNELYCTHYDISNVNSPQNNKVCVRLNKNGFTFGDNVNCTSTDTWKAYLAAQYAAGTPVTVIYPLATPTTESVAGQTLQVAQGDNTLSIIQASMPGLELETEYTKQG